MFPLLFHPFLFPPPIPISFCFSAFSLWQIFPFILSLYVYDWDVDCYWVLYMFSQSYMGQCWPAAMAAWLQNNYNYNYLSIADIDVALYVDTYRATMLYAGILLQSDTRLIQKRNRPRYLELDRTRANAFSTFITGNRDSVRSVLPTFRVKRLVAEQLRGRQR